MNDPLGFGFDFAGQRFIARASGALWWPQRQMLVVSDLHLGRSERYARRGGALLPPYEVTDTLARLSAEIAALQPQTLVSLGDGFDDIAAGEALAGENRASLAAIARQCDLIWVQGNHDPAQGKADLPGRFLAEIAGAPALRHEAGEAPDISGHFHPSTLLAGKRWRCFVKGADHLILPAFGTYTGGLDISAAPLAALAPKGIAILCAPRPFCRPMPKSAKG